MENENSNKEFKVLNLSIEKISLYYGLFLITWGVIVSLLSESSSVTSYIPSFLGLLLSFFSYLAIRFSPKKKLFMHIVVMIGLIIFFGGLDIIRSLLNGNVFENFWADASKTMMLLTGLYFLIQCIRSFIFARKTKV